MYALTFGDYELSPVGIHVYTSQGEGTYTNGIKADVKIADDLTRELGDPQERMLQKALKLLADNRKSKPGTNEVLSLSTSLNFALKVPR